MKKHIKTLLIAFLLTGTLVTASYAITPGRWDFDSAYDYVQDVAENIPLEDSEHPKIPQDQINRIRSEIFAQITSAKEYWRSYWRR